ncbi:MAG: hypothetical protein WBB67_00725 [bacterium]
MKSDKKMAIMVTAIMVISVFALVVPTSASVGGSVEVNKTVWDPVDQTWVKELNASIDDTLRFRCEIQYCWYSELPPLNRRFWDILDCSLEFADNATLNGDSYSELNAANNFTFKPKVLHPYNLSWDPYNPSVGSEKFHELCPEYCKNHTLQSRQDTNYDGRLSECDQIYLESGYDWYHVDNVPYTLNVTNIETNESMYIDSVLDYEAVNLNNPNGTEWLEVCCCKEQYTIVNWTDFVCSPDGYLSEYDTIVLRNERTGEEAEYTVEEVTIDLVVSKEWELGGDLVETGGFGITNGITCDNYTIEYDATVVRCGVDNNTLCAKGQWYEPNTYAGEGKVSFVPSFWVYSNTDIVTIMVSCISGEATDAAGGTKDVYKTTETVYATGSGFVPGSLVNIYITEDKHWIDGMHINSTVYARKDNVNVTPDGNIVGEEMWPNPIPGEYDMVFDANQNGFYDAGIDAIDDPNDPGFTVLGQVPALTPVGIAALVGLLTIIATSTILRKRKKR